MKSLESLTSISVDLFRASISKYDDIKEVDEKGYTLVTYCVRNDSFKLLEYILELGADPNGHSKADATPLVFAIIQNSISIVQLLIKYKVDVNLVNAKSINTPLTTALTFTRSNIVPLLLKHGADPDIKNKDKHYPLDIAVTRYNLTMAELLLPITNRKGWTKKHIDTLSRSINMGISMDVSHGANGFGLLSSDIEDDTIINAELAINTRVNRKKRWVKVLNIINNANYGKGRSG